MLQTLDQCRVSHCLGSLQGLVRCVQGILPTTRRVVGHGQCIEDRRIEPSGGLRGFAGQRDGFLDAALGNRLTSGQQPSQVVQQGGLALAQPGCRAKSADRLDLATGIEPRAPERRVDPRQIRFERQGSLERVDRAIDVSRAEERGSQLAILMSTDYCSIFARKALASKSSGLSLSAFSQSVTSFS